MRLILIFLLVAIGVSRAATTYSQMAQLSINLTNKSVKEVFSAIEQNSEYIFFYHDDILDVNRKVSIHMENQTIDKILDKVFESTNNTYVVDDRQIIISAKRATPAAPPVQQQSKTVTGTVEDNYTKEPLMGVHIVIKGTTTGTTTDIDGHFSLTFTQANPVLVFSYIGYITQEIAVGNRTSFPVQLIEDTQMVEELVVIGYGTQRKGDVSSAIASVKSEDFATGNIGDAAELIKGKVAGLSIVNPTGDPNTASSIRLRGTSSILGNNDPLILIDGVQGALDQVAPENIESIDILKDASASAIYGTRGANGVIIITTKAGRRASRTEASYSSYVSTSQWSKKAKFMDAEDIREGLTQFTYDGHDTDWLDAITRDNGGFTHNHSLSLRGGTQNSTYSGNFTFRDSEGIMRNSGRTNISTQVDYSQYVLNDILRFNINMLYMQNKSDMNNNNFAYRQALIHNPSSPIYNEDGSYYEEFSRYQYFNPVAIQNEYIGDRRTNLARITGNITFEPIKGWQTNLMLSRRESNRTDQSYLTSKYYSQATAGTQGTANKEQRNIRNDNLELTSRYNYSYEKHRLEGLAGYSYMYDVEDRFAAGNSNFPSEYYLYNNLGKGTFLSDPTRTATMSSEKEDRKLIAFLGRISYVYDNRYTLLASVRREGSSRFGDNHKWGTFPSISSSWNMHNEQFMKDIHWLNEFRVRLGFGISGNDAGESYNSLTLYNFDTTSSGRYYTQSGSWTPALIVSQNPNPDLKWEKTREWNLGFDWSVFNNRLSGDINLYTKKTVDLLYEYSVPIPPNMYNLTWANVGQMRNKGIELKITAVPVRTRSFEYNTTLMLSHNRNKLLSLSNDLYETNNFQETGSTTEPLTIPTHCMDVGTSLGDFWMLRSVGYSENGFVLVEVFENDEWVVREYDNKYKTTAHRQRMGTGMPKVFAGWNHSLQFKGFDLNLQFTGQFGYYILNGQRMYYENNSIAYNRLKSAADWHPAVDLDLNPVIDPETGKQKMVRLASTNVQGIWSDHLERGDFVKLTNFTLGYTLPLKDNKYVRSARVYVSGQNLFCITGYSGLDPEVSVSVLNPGYDDRDKYPTVRSFTLGVNINF